MKPIQTLFSWVLQASITASILIIIILIIKYILKDRLGVKWHYAIWFIVIVRLIVPYAPKSSLRSFNLFTFVNQESIQLQTPPFTFEPNLMNQHILHIKTHLRIHQTL